MFPFSYFRILFDFLFKALKYADIEFIIMIHSTLLLVLVPQSCLTLCTPWTVAHQTPLSMEFSRQENYRVGSHALLQGIFLIQGLTLGLLHCRWIFFFFFNHLSHQGSLTLPMKGIKTHVHIFGGWSRV